MPESIYSVHRPDTLYNKKYKEDNSNDLQTKVKNLDSTKMIENTMFIE